MPVWKQKDLSSKEVIKTPVLNKFAVLDMSSDDEIEESNQDTQEKKQVNEKVPTQQEESQHHFSEQEGRVWKLEAPIEAGSIFSRGKKLKNKKKEEDGWTSIVWNRPRFVNDDDEERKIKEEQLAEAALPTTPKYTEEDLSEEKQNIHKTSILAKEWAAKIQADLERVEEGKERRRTELSEDFVASLGKLSFFRKPMAV